MSGNLRPNILGKNVEKIVLISGENSVEKKDVIVEGFDEHSVHFRDQKGNGYYWNGQYSITYKLNQIK